MKVVCALKKVHMVGRWFTEWKINIGCRELAFIPNVLVRSWPPLALEFLNLGELRNQLLCMFHSEFSLTISPVGLICRVPTWIVLIWLKRSSDLWSLQRHTQCVQSYRWSGASEAFPLPGPWRSHGYKRVRTTVYPLSIPPRSLITVPVYRISYWSITLICDYHTPQVSQWTLIPLPVYAISSLCFNNIVPR